MRTTTFGVGTRSELVERKASPPPNTYTLPSDFDGKVPKGQVFSFGICRDAYARVYIKAHPAPDRALPGPGLYEVRDTPGKDALKYSMRPKTSAQRTSSLTMTQSNGRAKERLALEPTTSCRALVRGATTFIRSLRARRRRGFILRDRCGSKCCVSGGC
jgi:hypothetical protein